MAEIAPHTPGASIEGSSFFRGLSDDARTAMEKRATRIVFRSGERLVDEYETARRLLLIGSGVVRQSITLDGIEEVVGHAGPGALVGRGLLSGASETTSFTADAKTEALLWDEAAIGEVERESPGTRAALATALSVRERSNEPRPDRRARAPLDFDPARDEAVPVPARRPGRGALRDRPRRGRDCPRRRPRLRVRAGGGAVRRRRPGRDGAPHGGAAQRDGARAPRHGAAARDAPRLRRAARLVRRVPAGTRSGARAADVRQRAASVSPRDLPFREPHSLRRPAVSRRLEGGNRGARRSRRTRAAGGST